MKRRIDNGSLISYSLMALAHRTRQSDKAAMRQRGSQSPSCFLMVPCRSH